MTMGATRLLLVSGSHSKLHVNHTAVLLQASLKEFDMGVEQACLFLHPKLRTVCTLSGISARSNGTMADTVVGQQMQSRALHQNLAACIRLFQTLL